MGTGTRVQSTAAQAAYSLLFLKPSCLKASFLFVYLFHFKDKPCSFGFFLKNAYAVQCEQFALIKKLVGKKQNRKAKTTKAPKQKTVNPTVQQINLLCTHPRFP